MTDGHAPLDVDGHAPLDVDGQPSLDADGHRPGPVAGVDIGGTKIAVLLVDADGAVLGRATHSSSVGDQGGAVPAIAAALDEALAGAGLDRGDLEAIGVGVPGRVDARKGHVTLAVNLGWTDFALRDVLEAELGRPVVIENDARAAAVGLHERGVTDGDLAYLAVGTGIAAGVVLDGQLHRGARGLAGEIGHVISERDGPRCACGQSGCLEALASGPSIARRASELGGPAAATARDVYQAAAAGDPAAVALTEDVGRRLAWAVHLLVLTYDVHRVVVGGGVTHAGRPFETPLRRELERLRAVSDQAGELLPADIVEILPPEAEPGAWGAVAVARRAGHDGYRTSRETTAPERDGTSAAGGRTRGTEVVRHA